MNLDRVTITGADDSVTAADLVTLTTEFPFVEWGILVSRTNEGGPRFPSRRWARALVSAAETVQMRLSLHVCGRWVQRLMLGYDDLLAEWDPWVDGPAFGAPARFVFQRVQLNFHAQHHQAEIADAATLFRRRMSGRQIIVQMDGTGNEAILAGLRGHGIDAVPLFDTSGGGGIVPGEWPTPIPGIPYHGYAGGLGPDTLERELPRIAAAARVPACLEEVVDDDVPWTDARIWIDMERRVRSADDQTLDLAKVRRCLELCAPFVTA